MRLSRVQIENFRNFKKLDVSFGDNAVIVGENKVGKSNLLHALRLVLDPSLPDPARVLTKEDFWDGLPRPLKVADVITIAVDLTDFEANDAQLSLLSGYPVAKNPMVSRLTYVFGPKKDADAGKLKESDYEFAIYGGTDPTNRVGWDLRKRLPLDYLGALRDAEGDLSNWRKSPLRPLLETAASQIADADLQQLAKDVSQATGKVAAHKELKDLAHRITERLQRMVGAKHGLDLTLGFSPTESERLIRALRLFIDSGARGIGEASLGSANVLYLVLKLLEQAQLVGDEERDYTFLAIEEPEAHLHPHLQRLVYRDLLRRREHQTTDSDPKPESTTILLTTHSPHMVSVSPLQSLALLRKTADGSATEGVSAALIELDSQEVADLERYLDVTRGEMLFSKGVLLAEGDAELFLVPVLGRELGFDFDKLGITVCSVAGTNFTPYVKLLGPAGLNVPFAVLTDADPTDKGALGKDRVTRLLAHIVSPKATAGKGEPELLALAKTVGLFLNDHTLEVDLFKCGRYKSMTKTMDELTDNGAASSRAKQWAKDPSTVDFTQMLKDIKEIGKGRFAQRLATRIKGTSCPPYIAEAIAYVAQRCH